MSNLYWLSETQMERLQPYFPKNHSVPRVDDRRVLSGIISINRNGLRWRVAPREYGPHKTLSNRWKRWSDVGVFARIMTGLGVKAPDNDLYRCDLPQSASHGLEPWGKKWGAWTSDPLPGRVLRSKIPRGGARKAA